MQNSKLNKKYLSEFTDKIKDFISTFLSKQLKQKTFANIKKSWETKSNKFN